jgi:hypothetical protein
MKTSTTHPRRRPRKEISLVDLLRAEGAKPYEGERPGPHAASASAPISKQEAMVAALYDRAIVNKDLAAMRLILSYCEGRLAQVQVNIAQDRPSKTYVVVSPDDWPAE